ncbi:MAG: hypothetical protein H6999_07155 [Hahellaceae bacterium]|nr:hypothetical protein [Hahellaceae bacterium]
MITVGTTLLYLAAIAAFSFAVLCVAFSAWQAKPSPVPVQADLGSLQRRSTKTLLLLSAVPWLFTAQNLVKAPGEIDLAEQLQSLPATAAGISQNVITLPTNNALSLAQIASFADELASNPKGKAFMLLRQRIVNQLASAGSFNTGEQVITIDLSADQEQETIKYLAENRPGLLTVIHQQDASKAGPKVIIYFPEVMGNHIIYTPLNSEGAKTLSKM